MLKILQSDWTATLLGTALYIVTLVLTFRPPPPPPAQTKESKVAAMVASWNYMNPEADQLVAELKARKADLDQREADLHELENRLRAQRDELTQATQAVMQIQEKFDKNVLKLRESELANLKKLVKTYKNMAPEAVVAIFKGMDDDSVAKVFKIMKEDEAAPILNLMAAQGGTNRAAYIVERMRVSMPESATPAAPKTQ